jgi:peroxiredoxin
MKAFACLALLAAVGAVDVGFKIPSNIELHKGFPPEKVNLSEYVAGRSVLLVGLPGAFTPT